MDLVMIHDQRLYMYDVSYAKVSVTNFTVKRPHNWRSDSAQIGRREVPGSNPGRDCRPSRLEFSPKLA